MRLAGWTQEEPFRIAAVQPLEIQSGSADEAVELLAELLELLPAGDAFCPKTTEKMRSQLSQGQCPDYVCDILAYQFVRDVETLRALLAETDTTRRLRLLSDALRRL